MGMPVAHATCILQMQGVGRTPIALAELTSAKAEGLQFQVYVHDVGGQPGAAGVGEKPCAPPGGLKGRKTSPPKRTFQGKGLAFAVYMGVAARMQPVHGVRGQPGVSGVGRQPCAPLEGL